MPEPPTIWCVYGTRPEVIKMWPVARALEEHPNDVRVRRVFTGQHRELASNLFHGLDMEPDVALDLMTEDQRLRELGARCLTAFGGLLESEPPDYVLVQGDTSTVLFASLASYFQRIRVGHVEAGLRSHRKYSPFPEEMMRRLADAVADLHFAPTERAAANLRREGIDSASIHVTGNTAVDAVRAAASRASSRASPELRNWVERHTGGLVLLTLHRRESFGEGMQRILRAVAAYAEERPDLRILYPVHPNPNVLRPVRDILGEVPNVSLREPVGYFDMVYLLTRAAVVLTDSGGIQEEAPALGREVLVARTVTERPEGVEAGVARLVGTDPDRILAELRRATQRDAAGRASKESRGSAVTAVGDTPYGDGRAGERIADILVHALTRRGRRTQDWNPPLGR